MAKVEEPFQLPSPKAYQDVVSQFLSAIHFRMQQHEYDYSLHQPLSAYIEKQPWPEDLKARTFELAKWISLGNGFMFPHVTRKSRLYYGIYCLLVTTYDDVLGELQGKSTPEEIEAIIGKFTPCLINGETQGSPLLQSLATFLRNDLDAFQGPYAATMATKATIEYVEGAILECAFEGPPKKAVSFPTFLRIKTGIAEVWGHWAFPEDTFPEAKYRKLYLPAMPALGDSIIYINDILSFYKETMIGPEQTNTICNIASAKNLTLLEALEELVEYTIARVWEYRAVLAPYPELLKYADGFILSYIGWHFNEAWRYHLDDMCIVDVDGKPVEGHRKLGPQYLVGN